MTTLICNFQDIVGETINGYATLSAGEVRTGQDSPTVVLNTPSPPEQVNEGEATFENVEPGPAVLQLHWNGQSATLRFTVPNTPETITLSECVEQTLEYTPSVVNRVLEQIEDARDEMIGQVSEVVPAALQARDDARDAADRAENVADMFGSLEGVAVSVQEAEAAATSATGSASAAALSATDADDSQVSAASSATAAAQSAVNADNSERVAGEHKGAAEAAATSASVSASAASASAGAAASSESAAAMSAGQADVAAGVSSDAADRAENVVASVHWQDDRLSVMGQLSPSLTGDDGATPHVGPNGTWWVGNTDTGVQAQGEKGDPGDGSGDVLWTELTPVLDGKALKSHKHTMAQISDLPTVSSQHSLNTIAQRDGSGHVNVGLAPSQINHAASKFYVDTTRKGVIHSGSGGVPETIPGAVVGDFWLNTDTMELHKITAV